MSISKVLHAITLHTCRALVSNPATAYDWDGVPGVCIPAYDASNTATFDETTGKPLRPDSFCQEAHSDSEHLTQHYTIVFNVFVLMQIFNEINSRKVPLRGVLCACMARSTCSLSRGLLSLECAFADPQRAQRVQRRVQKLDLPRHRDWHASHSGSGMGWVTCSRRTLCSMHIAVCMHTNGCERACMCV